LIVLRFTFGATTQDVRTPRDDLVVGSDPTADVTLAAPGLAPRAFRLVRDGLRVEVQPLGAEGQATTLQVGDEIRLAGVGIALVGLMPAGTGYVPPFGGYEEDAPAPRTFALSEERPAPSLDLPGTGANRPPASPPSRAAPAEVAGAPKAPPGLPGRGPARRRERHHGALSPSLPGPTARTSEPPPAAAAAAALSEQERLALLARLRGEPPNVVQDLYRQLKRAPFFAISLAFHLLVLFLLALIQTGAPRTPPSTHGSLRASVDTETLDPDEQARDTKLDHLQAPEDPLPGLDKLVPDDPKETPELPPAPPSSPFEEEDVVRDVRAPPDIGVMPGLNATSHRTRRLSRTRVDPRKAVTKANAGSSNEESARAVREQVGRGPGGRGGALDRLDADDLLVVTGTFDHIERVLDALRLPYTKRAPWSLVMPRPEDFRHYKVVFWDCGEGLGPRRMTQIGKRLERYVRDGGYLFTTDWGVANVLPYAFPGYLDTDGDDRQVGHLPPMVLKIRPARGARDHPLLEGVFHRGVQAEWWLEQASFPIIVKRPDKVTVLIEGPALQEQYRRSPAVAVTFNHGRGRVLHAMGHYFQEAGNLAGTMSAHRLALNFVLMRLDQDRHRR
jgi:hypothetical protein